MARSAVPSWRQPSKLPKASWSRCGRGTAYNDPQSILHAAARGGPLPFLLSFLGGAIFTPFGEEILFRGVVANALNRYGAFAGVVLSSIIFGIAHGVSVILPVAIMVGLLSAILFRATGSVWPSVVLHCVYNAANSIASAFGFAPMP
ncbi:CPBP family intramembrane glutamic endopeptidase [Rhizobium leguminosarum]|uniref:CPBP family intramembrane glutamic endopeptidase n=1 Tax=Rhizobium leguminosarum TaxID=384 RepID=UPI001FEFEEDD|nr:CPBP family intramembrane glutamic endopeptidase [Rhizobium leguminosarum]